MGVRACGSGAKRNVHQRVVKRLVGVRKGREEAGERVCGCVGRVPKGKCTNESLNDSLVEEKGGRRPGSGCVGVWVGCQKESAPTSR